MKFKCDSSEVKCVSFHPRHPWLLMPDSARLVKLWDYDTSRLLLDMTAHHTNPLFASDGDDCRVKVRSCETVYKTKCIFSLSGHQDYVRWMEFHPLHPWLVTASDDCTVRLWNWQARTELAVYLFGIKFFFLVFLSILFYSLII